MRPGNILTLGETAKWRRIAEVIALAAVLIWGGVLRLGWPGVNPFAFDEARLSLLALEMARNGHLPAAGLVSSAGIPNFPASVWPFAIPYALSSDPLAAIGFVGLMSLACVLALWWMARAAWGPWAGLTTAILAAGSPYLAFYSRNIWGQDWLPILAVAWALLGTWGVARGKRWAVAASAFLAGFAFQVHYAGAALLVLCLLLALRRGSEDRWPWFAGLGAALLAAVLSGREVIRIVVDKLGSGTVLGLRAGVQSLGQFIALATGYNWDWLFIGDKWRLSTGPAAMAMGAAAGILMVAGLLGLGMQAWRKRKEPLRTWADALGFLVPVWALASPLLWLVRIAPVHIHYHLVSLPALFLAAGYAASLNPRRCWRYAVVALALAVSLGQGLLFIRGLEIAGEYATPGGISTPLRFHRAAVGFVRDGVPVVAVVPGNRPEFDGDAAVLHALLWGYPHRLVDGRYSLVLSPPPAWLLFVAPWIPAWEEASTALPEGSGDVYFIPRRTGEYPYVAVRLRETNPQGFTPVEPALLANGVQLVGWKVHPQGDGFRFVTLWEVVEVPPNDDFHQFNHLYVKGASEPVEVRDVPVSSQAWAQGDYIITWADFAKGPSGEEPMMAVGMYRYPSLERVPRVGVEDPLAPIWVGPLEETLLTEGGVK